jgi:hypothetical protein
VCAWGQVSSSQRTFPQSKADVEKALKTLQPGMSGRLPSLEGFAQSDGPSLDRYQRGFYQITADLSPSASGSTLVRLSAKVTAWFSDPQGSQSGYQLLKSNGRLEADLLDQLAEQLSSNVGAKKASAASIASATPKSAAGAGEASVPDNQHKFATSMSHDLAAPGTATEPGAARLPEKKNPLQEEADNLEKILKNTAHPSNLVAVKKSGTPVVSTPSLTAKPQFLASMHDEFELLDFNADWVHVRISGLSRGWIWRNSVEMPEGIPDTVNASPLKTAADLFRVSREETAQFPGDWEPLRGKSVKIISVQQADESSKDTGSKDRLEYVKYLLEKSYAEVSKHPELQGVVVIFDSADGGMIAATNATLAQWKAGTLTDSALWHKCFFDPPESFDSTAASGSR